MATTKKQLTNARLKRYTAVRKAVLLTFYVLLMTYALILAPRALTDISQVVNVVSGPAAESNPLFRALFGVLFPIGIGMFALQTAGAPSQPWFLPVELFGLLGAFLGFYGGGLYMALREYAPSTKRESLARESWLVRAMESRLVALFVFGYSLRSYGALFPLEGAGAKGWDECLAAFWQLVQSDRYAWASSIDILVLSVVVYGPLAEDMRRRGWMSVGPSAARSRALAASVMMVPGVGLGAYLLFRPKLEGRAL